MTVWAEDFRAIVERARAELEAEGGLHPTGPTSWALTQPVREAVWEDLDSGAYQEAVRQVVAGDPEMQQL